MAAEHQSSSVQQQVGRPSLIRAIAGYFSIVFGAGFVLGPARAMWLEPAFGPTLAVMCEMPFLIIAMALAARWVLARFAANTHQAGALTIGVSAALLVLGADFTVGLLLRSMNGQQQLAYLTTPAGLLYVSLLAVFALMPLMMHVKRSRA
jgi:hypothetical protein